MIDGIQPDPPPTRRFRRPFRFQFSLATLFRLITVVAIVLGVARLIGPEAFVVALVTVYGLVYLFAPLTLLVVICSLPQIDRKRVLAVMLPAAVILVVP